ncbi:MAG: energy transducer TonB [Planctomycetota bacterium]
MADSRARTAIRLRHRVAVVLGGAGCTFACFLVLPLMQAIGKQREDVVMLTSVDTVLPPPPEQQPPEPEKPPEKEEKPPELDETPEPLDLSQLELALNPTLGGGGGWLAGDFGVKLDNITRAAGGGDDVFADVDLDQKPKVVFDTPPALPPKLRHRAGTVVVLFDVSPEGRVENPVVHKSSDPEFDPHVLGAIRQWRFEPGKRNNKPVRFRMKLPFKFQKS